MKLNPIENSHLKAEGYDPQTHTLRIEFANGVQGDYDGVTPELYTAFLEAPSRGSFLANIIKPGCPYRPVKKEE